MDEKIPIYDCKLKDEGNGIFAMSFVDDPAIESYFVALRNEEVKLSRDDQKQILTGAVLIPDKLIYRNSTEMGEFYIKFTAQEIEKISHQMMHMGVALSNTTHQHAEPLDGNYMVEQWIVMDSKNDKSNAIGLGELPPGTLCASYKIPDSQYWRNEVMSGNVKGFSIEGQFNLNKIKMKNEKKENNNSKMFMRFQKAWKTFLTTEQEAEGLVEQAAKDETESGEPAMIFDLQDGNQVYVGDDGFAKLNNESQMAAGEHQLADGNIIVIDGDGYLVVTEPEGEGSTQEEAITELKKQQAVERGKKFLAQLSAKDAQAIEKQIKELSEEVVKLKKSPSATKVEASLISEAKDPTKLPAWERVAVTIKETRNLKK